MNANNDALVMFMSVGNEVEIIGENIKFHQSLGVDHFVITDDYSTDGTREKLDEMASEASITLLDAKAYHPRHVGRIWMDKVIALCVERFNPAWMIKNDADEFWCPANGGLKTHFGGHDVYQVTRKNMIPSSVGAMGSSNYSPVRQSLYSIEKRYAAAGHLNMVRKSLSGEEFERVDVSWGGDGKPLPLVAKEVGPKLIFNPNSVDALAWGGHAVTGDAKKPYVHPLPEIEILHYIVPSKAKYIDKIKQYDRHMESIDGFNHGSLLSWHTRYQSLCNKYGMSDLEYDGYFIEDEVLPKLTDDGLIRKDTRVIDVLRL